MVITLVVALIGTPPRLGSRRAAIGVIYACVNNSSGELKIVVAGDTARTTGR